MSTFKFACPVCGQHITCDAGSSGTEMDCPTCFRKLVVPQAPATGSQNFVLTAAEVHTRPVPLPGGGAAATPRPARKLPLAAIALGMLMCALGAGIYFYRDKIFSPGKPTVEQGTNASIQVGELPHVPAGFLPASTNWTLNLEEAKIPNAPVSGNIMGRAFSIERAVIQGGRLELRQGPKWPPDVGVSIHLFAERSEGLAGRTVVLEATRANAPRVILRWKDEQDKALTKDFRQGYAARVEFGPVTGKRLEGKIYLATPDDAKSYAAGTFSAEIREPARPKK